jgi:hypothetical protein
VADAGGGEDAPDGRARPADHAFLRLAFDNIRRSPSRGRRRARASHEAKSALAHVVDFPILVKLPLKSVVTHFEISILALLIAPPTKPTTSKTASMVMISSPTYRVETLISSARTRPSFGATWLVAELACLKTRMMPITITASPEKHDDQLR